MAHARPRPEWHLMGRLLVFGCMAMSLAGQPARPAPAALAAKAPGHPSYGLQVNTEDGPFLLTHLRYDPISPAGRISAYRLSGPATWGPYRLGMDLGSHRSGVVGKSEGIWTWSYSRFEVLRTDPGGPARRAGLDETWWVLEMDGRAFQWQLPTLLYYATRRPTVEVLAQKRSGWGKGKEKRFQIELQKLEAPVDPSAAEVEDTTTLEQVLQPLGPQLAEPALWRTLARLRSSTPRFAPIPVVLEGRTWWVVRGAPAAQRSHAIGLDPNRQPRWLIRGENAQIPGATERLDLAFLEFWEADPCGDATVAAPAFLCAEPPDQVLKGRLLRLRGHWFEVAEAALDPGSGRLAKFRVEPWKADALSLLRGELPARNLGPSAPVADLAALEQLGNEALIEWKTRALPGLLATLTVNPAEDLVIRLEKGILDLDLTAKRLRARLDEEARAEVARKAQAELAAKRGQAAPIAQGASTEDLERVADLLEQRKAILMAVLGNAKQALASLRR